MCVTQQRTMVCRILCVSTVTRRNGRILAIKTSINSTKEANNKTRMNARERKLHDTNNNKQTKKTQKILNSELSEKHSILDVTLYYIIGRYINS